MKYSIIIPTIGRETLSEVLTALYACKGFSSFNIEVLVIFDGIKGSVPKNLKRKELKVLTTKRKVYSAGARNLGIKKSKGDIICFIGDDTIPDKNWLKKIVTFHRENPAKTDTLLGRIAWVDKYANDPFYQFLENGPQFNFGQIQKRGKPSWKHFYTSNISLKRAFLIAPSSTEEGRQELILFSENFKGWGFEDIEFAYRLYRRGMKMGYDPDCIVYHDDPQTLAQMIERTKNARKNAHLFQCLHRRVRIIPRGFRRFLLMLFVFGAKYLSPFSKKIKWWYLWKKAWLG